MISNSASFIGYEHGFFLNILRGIFANVGFDTLNRRKAFEPKEKKDDKVTWPPNSKSEPAVAKVSPKEKKEDITNIPSRPRASDFMKDSTASEEEERGGEEASDGTFRPAKPPAASSAGAGAIHKVLGEFAHASEIIMTNLFMAKKKF